MSEEYLWNRTGEPDPEIVRLEEVLGQLKYVKKGAAPGRKRWAWWLAAAAVVIAGVVAVPLLSRGRLTNWQLSTGVRVRAGQPIETGKAQQLKMQAEDTGEVTIEPGSRLRIVQDSNREQRFNLEHGIIHAFIWAPPGKFIVDTPSSKTVDLGCQYTLQVLQNGTGLVSVELGWVAFETKGLESFIPAGAACVTRPVLGPGTPYFVDAPRVLKEALARFDTTGETSALKTVVASARQRDALSLWHLLVRTKGTERSLVLDRFSSFVQLPRDVTREAILAGDGKAIDAAWNALNLGDTGWWREWKRQW